MESRGWKELDIILVTGDAYVDHTSYGTAILGRVLEGAGYRVGVIAQPDWKSLGDFKRLSPPKLFFGVSAGNLDSMVANYTANKKLRSEDDYSPAAKPHLRPDRAVTIYTNRLREAFPGAKIVIGGMEASSRRLAHYDYWSDKIKRSILLDSKADILVYGMGESQILEIADRLKEGEDIKSLGGIKGTVVVRNDISAIRDYISIPSFEEVVKDKDKFNEAFRAIYSEADPIRGRIVIQRHGDRFVVQFPPALPLSQSELDRIYSLDYARAWHPVYDKAGGVPGFEAVRFSVISHRGCPGACNFCSLYLHQGRLVQSRTPESIISEIERIARSKDFKGTITDIGGATANLYKAECRLMKSAGGCKNKKCLMPKRCENLKLGYADTLKLWEEILKIPGVKHLFIGSGVRYDLLTEDSSDEFLKELCKRHISGRLKVAPEHSETSVLELMGKPPFKCYEKFIARFNRTTSRLNKKEYLVNYFISSHPGATLKSALELSLELMKKRIYPEQIQDFLPLPMTASGCMYYTEKDPFSGKDVYVAKGERERKLQRALVQYKHPENRRYVIEALEKLKRPELRKLFHLPSPVHVIKKDWLRRDVAQRKNR